MGNFGLLQIQFGLKAKLLIGCLTITLLLSGCTVWRTIPFRNYETPELPEEYRTYYDYPKHDLEATVLQEEDRGNYLFRQVEFPLYLPDELWTQSREAWKAEVDDIRPTNEKEAKDRSLHYTNRVDMYLPKKESARPLILISPILGGNMVVDIFARFFARHGYVAVIVHRKKTFYNHERGAEQVEDYLRTSVIRLRQSLDWLEKQPEIDANRIGSFGISYGAVLHVVLAAVEPRVRYHIFAMPGAPIADVIVTCPDPGIKKWVKELRSVGWTKDELHQALKKVIKTDPLYLAPYVPKKRVMVMMALFDRIVGAHRTFRLWNALNRPRLRLIPLGHYGGVLVYPYLEIVSLFYFSARL